MKINDTIKYSLDKATRGSLDELKRLTDELNERNDKFNRDFLRMRIDDMMTYFIEVNSNNNIFDELNLCGISSDEYENFDKLSRNRMEYISDILSYYITLRDSDKDGLSVMDKLRVRIKKHIYLFKYRKVEE